MTLSSPSTLFDQSCELDKALLVLIPMPWQVTASFGVRTARAPEAIQSASFQMDYDHPFFGDVRSLGIAMDLSCYKRWKHKSAELREFSEEIIQYWEKEHRADESCDYPTALKEKLSQIERETELVFKELQGLSEAYLAKGKKCALIGGDHSSPLGLYRALHRTFEQKLGLLHIDAHCDLRPSFQGFKHSHASIFYRALEEDVFEGKDVFQVGIRDRSFQEVQYAEKQGVSIHSWPCIRKKLFEGESFSRWVGDLCDQLPQNLWISVDVDGLSPDFCPSTGTPVPGGFSFDQIEYLLERLSSHEKNFKVMGFDLCEVGIEDDLGSTELENSWDAQVGARLLYALSALTLRS